MEIHDLRSEHGLRSVASELLLINAILFQAGSEVILRLVQLLLENSHLFWSRDMLVVFICTVEEPIPLLARSVQL